MARDDVEFVYVGDPMCSWCWGFAPVLRKLGDHYDLPIQTVVGGLRPGPSAQPLDDAMRRYLAREWGRIEERTGQPFDHSSLEREGWIYDTELPAIAVTTMRASSPDDTLDFFERLQRAFYAEATDITDPAAYPELLTSFPVDPDEFVRQMGTEEAKERAWADFAVAQRLGVRGFPTLLLRVADDMAVVTTGYRPFDEIEPPLSRWLEARGLETTA